MADWEGAEKTPFDTQTNVMRSLLRGHSIQELKGNGSVYHVSHLKFVCELLIECTGSRKKILPT